VVASHHVPNIGNAVTPLTMGPIGTTLGSKQHICCKSVSLVLVVTANRTVNVLVLWGAEIRNIHNFDETWMIVPLWYKNMVEKQQILIKKNLRRFITVKAHCSMTHLKQQKSLGFFYSTPLGHG